MAIGKLFMVIGALLMAVGAVIWLLARMGFRGLPGDIRVESGRMTFYFPVVSCLVLSILLTLGFWIVQILSKGR